MYPKVKVRRSEERDQNYSPYLQGPKLKPCASIPVTGSPSPGSSEKGHTDLSTLSTAKISKSLLPHAPTPRIALCEDLGLKNLSLELTETEKANKDTIDDKMNIRASSIPRPRAVLSSPDNDVVIGNKNRTKDKKLLSSRNPGFQQNRHACCKSKTMSSDINQSSANTRKSKENAESKIDVQGKKRPTNRAPVVPWQ